MKLLNTPFYIALLIMFLLMLASCNAERKAEKFYQQHPDKLALKCATQYPVKDSIVRITDTLIMSDNKDYSGMINSVKLIADSIKSKAVSDSLEASVSHVKCKEVVSAQEVVNSRLRAQIAALQASYKPCKPDTLRQVVEHYIRDRAYEQTQSDTVRKLQDANMVLQHDYNNMKAAKRKFELWFFILLGAAGLYTFLKIKRLLPF